MQQRLVLVAVSTLLATAATAHAEDLKDAWGFGADTSLGGISGASVRFGLESDITLQGIVAASFFSPSEGGSETALNLGLGAIYEVLADGAISLGLRGGLDIGFLSPSVGESGTQVGLSAAVRPELFLSEVFSLHAQLGLIFEFVPARGRINGQNPQGANTARNQGSNLALNLDLLGTAGFTFWY